MAPTVGIRDLAPLPGEQAPGLRLILCQHASTVRAEHQAAVRDPASHGSAIPADSAEVKLLWRVLQQVL